ncbi:hypothetical protein [Hymenobacter gelipurpurascens]|nr:hypothetical protein [Hymenobacter gelipurpurascens]
MAFPLLVPTLVMLNKDANSVIAVTVTVVYLVIVFFASRGQKLSVLLMSLYILCLCTAVMVGVLSNGPNDEESIELIKFKQKINPNYATDNTGIPLWSAILMCLLLMYPFYRAVKAVLVYKNEIQEFKSFKNKRKSVVLKNKSLLKILIALGLLILSYCFIAVSAIAFVAGGVSATFGYFGYNLIGLIVSGFGIKYGRKLVVLSKRHLTNTILETRGKDVRPPILLIRSFQDDALKLERGKGFKLTQWLSPIPTLEETLCRRLSLSGPVIAIGNPKEKLPPLGAARDYYDDSSWMDQIDALLTESKYVVAILGNTNSLELEFKKIKNYNLLNKLILVFPPKDITSIHARWSAFIKIIDLPIELEINEMYLLMNFNNGSINNIAMCKDKKCDSYEVAVSKILAHDRLISDCPSQS